MKLRVGSLEAFQEGVGMRVEHGETSIAVFRIGDDLYAIGDRCSHAEASLSEGEVFGTEVECPRHGSGFDLTTGRPGSLPATQPVLTYELVVEDGEVFVVADEAQQ